MNKEHLVKCPHCERRNFTNNTSCSWCGRKLPEPWERVFRMGVVLVSIASIISVIYVLNQVYS